MSLNLYSLIETCKANNVDVYQYLIDLFKALPLAQTVDDYEALLPCKLGKLVRKPKT
ncbi:MAG: transposase domain-containing protein [Burkholderia sp.]